MADEADAADGYGRGRGYSVWTLGYIGGTSGSALKITNSVSVAIGTATGFTFANARQIAYNYDELYRRTDIAEGTASLAAWEFFGPGRAAELTLGNGMICTYMNNARTHSAVQWPTPQRPAWGDQSSDRLGYDGAGRTIAKRYLGATIGTVGFTTQYDPASNKDYERHLHAESRSHVYPALDSLDRLLEYQRGTLEEEDDAVSVSTPISLPDTDTRRTYNLDTLGNWRNTVYTPVGGAETTETRQHNYVNQVTKFAGTAVEYDHGDNTGDDSSHGNGNIADDGMLVTAPVGKYKPNAWGVHDLHGNVWEWTRSTYRSYPWRDDDGRNGANATGQKVIRGGSWRDRPKRCRSGFRLSYPPWQKVYNVGFRVVVGPHKRSP